MMPSRTDQQTILPIYSKTKKLYFQLFPDLLNHILSEIPIILVAVFCIFVDEELNLDNQQPILPATSVKSIIEKFNRSNSMQLVNNPIVQTAVNNSESIDSRHSRFGLNNGGDVVYSHSDGNCVDRDDDEDDDDEWDDDDEDDEDENNAPTFTNLTNNPKSKDNDEVKIEDKTLKCRYIADEYCKMEEKQAKLCMILANNVYKKMDDENKQQKLCDHDDLVKLFYCCIETEKLASMIHKQIALEIRERLNNWSTQPFFGDILLKYYHYYKLYKAILQRYPLSKETLVELLKKQKFAASLQKIMTAEATNLDNLTRLDIHIDQIVNLPRRYIQLLQTYIKHIDTKEQEYEDITKVLTTFLGIFDATDDSLDKINQFQECWRLQNMIEPYIELVSENATLQRQLIKEGSLNKISRKNGAPIQRHLILLSDMLLICGVDRLKKKYICKYNISVNQLTIVENPNQDSNDKLFRITCPSQNNEFVTEDSKEKDAWIKAFKKLPEIKFDKNLNVNEIEAILNIGDVAPIWVKDSTQTYCLICKASFTAIKRRHHCRTCGKIYCSVCCNYYRYVKFDNYRNKQRVCKVCDFALEKDSHQSHQSISSSSTSSLTNVQVQNQVANNQTSPPTFGFIDTFKDAASAKLTEFKENFMSLSTISIRNNNQLPKKSVDLTDFDCPTVPLAVTNVTDVVQSSIPSSCILQTITKSNVSSSSDEDKQSTDSSQQENAIKNTPRVKFIKNQSDSNIGQMRVTYKSHQSNNQQNISILFSDNVLVGKLNKNLEDKQIMWDKQVVQLMDNNTIEIFTTPNDKIPNSLIYLNNFYVSQLNDTVVELKLKSYNHENDSGCSDADSGLLNATDGNNSLSVTDVKTCKLSATRKSLPSIVNKENNNNQNNNCKMRMKNRLSIFEYTNYQFKFLSVELKNKFIKLLGV